MRNRLTYSLAVALVLSGCGGLSSYTPTVFKAETVICPPRQPEPTCTVVLPVDVTDAVALQAYVKASTPRKGSQRTAEALSGWAGCAAEIQPYRAGYESCQNEEEE